MRHGHPLGQQELDELAVDELVGRTGQAAHQQRQRIGENGRQQLPVDRRQRAVGGGEYHQPRHRAGDEVGDEDPPHAEVGGEESRDAEGDGQRDVEHRAQRLDSDEGERAPLLAKPRKGNAGPDVEQDDEADPDDVFGVRDIGFAHQAGDVAAEKDHRRDEKQRRERRGAPGRGEEPPFGPPHVAARRLGPGRKAEIARLHAHRQERERQRNQGIDVGDDSVGLLPEFTGIVRREQIAQETHRDRADAVNGGLSGQLFEHKECLIGSKDTNFSGKSRRFSFFRRKKRKARGFRAGQPEPAGSGRNRIGRKEATERKAGPAAAGVPRKPEGGTAQKDRTLPRNAGKAIPGSVRRQKRPVRAREVFLRRHGRRRGSGVRATSYSGKTRS